MLMFDTIRKKEEQHEDQTEGPYHKLVMLILKMYLLSCLAYGNC